MRKQKLLSLLLLAALCFIWGQSLLPPEISRQESDGIWSRIMLPLLRFLTGRDTIRLDPRKAAHVFEYFVLGLISALLGKHLGLCGRRIPLLISLCGLVALCDETIQIFTGRGPMIQDIWIDLAGAVPGIFAGFLIRQRKKTNEQNGPGA